MNNLQGPLRVRAEAFLEALPFGDKDNSKKAFNLLLQNVRLSSDDLVKCQELLHGKKVERQKIEKLTGYINARAADIRGTYDDAHIVQAVADVIFQLFTDRPFAEKSEELGLLLSNFLMSTASRACMLFTSDDVQAIRAACQSKNRLCLWVANRFRDAVVQRGEIYTRNPGQQDNRNITYISPSGENLIIQWNNLETAERAWNT